MLKYDANNFNSKNRYFNTIKNKKLTEFNQKMIKNYQLILSKIDT